MKIIKIILISAFIVFFSALPVLAQTKDLLSPAEALWLKERNNTIVVYPEQNAPPYSYQDPAGNIQGLSIDYIELIAQKIGVKIQYLTPRSRDQIKTDIQAGKGDVAFFSQDTGENNNLLFTESYATVPVVIVVRKDYTGNSDLTLNDFNGKRVAMVAGSYTESYVSTNYPRVVREEVTDDEISLQQVVLGEVDSAVMDVASLSYYLSKQVLSSVKIGGDVGLDYKPAFAMTTDKEILQSILEKGLSQISANDRSLLADKWVALPGARQQTVSSFMSIMQSNLVIATLYVLFGIGLIAVIFMLLRRSSWRMRHFRKMHDVNELKDEFSDLEGESNILTHELEQVKMEEDKLKEKLKSLGD